MSLSVVSVQAFAAEATTAQHSFSGFASLGLVSSSNDELAFRRDVTFAESSHEGEIDWRNDSLVGVQWNGRWTHQWDTTVQMVAKDRFVNNLENSIEWAFVRYRPADGLDFRLGRVGTDIFMISEYRQVGYALPWVRPPHDTYGLLSLYHFDGADVTRRFNFDESSFSIKLFYGNSDEKYPTVYNSDDGIRIDFDLGGVTLNYDRGHWKWRASYIDVAINNDMVPVLGDGLLSYASDWPEATEWAANFNSAGKHFTYGEFGVNYDNNNWWVQAEAVRLDSDIRLIPSGDFGYVSAGKRLDRVSLYALAGYATPEDSPAVVQAPQLPDDIATSMIMQGLALGAQAAINNGRIDQQSIGLGARWDFTAKMAIKFQVEEFQVKPNGTNLWFVVDSQGPIAREQSSTVISLALDMLF